jgi:uncharacterized protein (DUF1015 family)
VATFKPFRGLRYDPGAVGNLATVIAPPYDVIDPAARDSLYARSAYNVVRLESSRDADAYAAAAALLADWREQGILVRDATPSLYLYGLRFAMPEHGELERFGVIGALRLERFDSGRVLPHERTLEKAKSDRLALLRACRASLSPIFGLVSVPDWSLGEIACASPPQVDVIDDSGSRHRLWRLTDPAMVSSIEHKLVDTPVFIADGHHRYETALRYRDEVRAALGSAAPPPGSAPCDYMLAYLTTMEDPGLVILPTHRVLRSPTPPPPELRASLAERFTIEDLPWTETGMARLLAELTAARTPRAGASRVRIGAAVAGAGALWLLSAPPQRLPLPPEVPAALRGLDVVALHQVVLAGTLGLPIGDRGGTPGMTYTQESSAALRLVDTGVASAAFFLPPTDVETLRNVSLAGLTMPEKSTYFHPKLATGLVIYPLDTPADGAPAQARSG